MKELSSAGAESLSRLLRMAVMAGVESAVQIHIERGDDLDARDATGMTPLMLSAVRNKPAICKMLLGAGADPSLVDPSGRTALQLALSAGSDATAAILKATSAPLAVLQPRGFGSSPEATLQANGAPLQAVPAQIGPEEPASASIEPRAFNKPEMSEPTVDGEFDLSGWEVEEEHIRPPADIEVVTSATAIQTAITAHKPVDSSTKWDDIDAFLPEDALPLARADDVEGRAKLRRLLLRALREGSVPLLEVQDQANGDDFDVNVEAEACLTRVINDLGAEVDERFEYCDASENFEVFVDPQETLAEEEAVDDALQAIDRAVSTRNEPLRMYQREFQHLQLLSAEEEIQLAKDMENALEAALDALALWPEGVALTLKAGAKAVAGSRQMSSVWLGKDTDLEAASAESLVTEAVEPSRDGLEEAAENGDGLAEDEQSSDGDRSFADALGRLAALVERDKGSRASFEQIRQAVAGLRLNRVFLLELTDAANGLEPCPRFRAAMGSFRNARDRMAVANLKLAFFHAKKFLHCGEPLDDLAQVANIGLLKAVDRYDWRRGFRLSTYATWWIRQSISRYVADKVRTIRVPLHVYERLQRTSRLAYDFEISYGREPALDELSKLVEMPRHKLAALVRIAREPAPLDDATVDCMIAIDARDDYVSPDPADVVERHQLTRAVEHYLSLLSAKDRKEERILRMRFGVGVPEALTLDEIGTRLGVTRERIRQIESKAIRKLRHSELSEAFVHTVLGVEAAKHLPTPGAQDSEGEGGADAGASPPPPAVPIEAQSPQEAIQSAAATRQTALDRVLAKAVELGVAVEDGRLSTSGRVWVRLVKTPDNSHRKLVRKLIEFGFEHSPGKGYWR